MAWHQILMGVLFSIAGVIHFIKPRFYLKIMPPYIPYPTEMVFISGITEILSGILLLIPCYQFLGALGILLHLIVFIPVHIHMFFDPKTSMGMPKWLLWLRLFIQFGLIFWVIQYL